jgi:hypothetical protein
VEITLYNWISFGYQLPIEKAVLLMFIYRTPWDWPNGMVFWRRLIPYLADYLEHADLGVWGTRGWFNVNGDVRLDIPVGCESTFLPCFPCFSYLRGLDKGNCWLSCFVWAMDYYSSIAGDIFQEIFKLPSGWDAGVGWAWLTWASDHQCLAFPSVSPVLYFQVKELTAEVEKCWVDTA